MKYIYAVFAVLLTMLGLYSAGQRAGRKSAEHAQADGELRAIREARKIENEINSLPDDDAVKRLRRDWSR